MIRNSIGANYWWCQPEMVTLMKRTCGFWPLEMESGEMNETWGNVHQTRGGCFNCTFHGGSDWHEDWTTKRWGKWRLDHHDVGQHHGDSEIPEMGTRANEILPESQILPDPFPGLVPLNGQNNFLNMVYGIGSVGFIISISFMVQTNFQCYNPILCWLTTSAWAAHQGRPPESPERCHTECEVAQNESLHSVQTASQTSTCLHTQKIAMLVAYRTSDSCSCLWLIAAFYMLLHVLASCRWLVCSQKAIAMNHPFSRFMYIPIAFDDLPFIARKITFSIQWVAICSVCPSLGSAPSRTAESTKTH